MVQNPKQPVGTIPTRVTAGRAAVTLGLCALALATLVPAHLVASQAAHPTPESCAACVRASDLMECHRIAVDLAKDRDFARAIAIEERVQDRLPMNAEVAASLARMYQLGTTNTARAIALYHAALHASSGYPPALLGLGSIMQQKGEMDIAARYYGRAVRERPDDPIFKVRLAEVLLQSGRDVEAQPLLQDVVKNWPDSGEAESARKLLSRTALAKP